MEVKKFLSNSKMGKLVAHLLGKTDLAVKDGKVELSQEEKDLIRTNYGEGFLIKLENCTFEDGQQEKAQDLFDEAVNFHTSALKKELADKNTLITKLQREIAKLIEEPEPAPGASAAGSLKPAIKLDLAAKHNKLAAQVLAGDNPLAFMQMESSAGSIDVTDLNSEFQMAMPPKMRLELLTKRLYAGFDDAKHMTRVQSNTDYIASQAIMTEVSQQFTAAWTPKGTAKFTPRRIPYRRHKINVSIKPADIIPSWLLYMYEQGKTLAEMPITHYIINEHILPKLLEDITVSMLGKGKFVDAGVKNDGDAAPAAKNSMDGYETILVEGKSDPKCKMNFYKAAKDPYTLTGQDLLDYVNGFVDSISSLFAGKMEIHCAPELLKAYQRADFAVNGKYTGEMINGQIRFTTFSLIPLESMYGSPIIFATPKENFVELVDLANASNCVQKIKEYDYDIHVIGEYSLSTGFKVEEAVYAAVPDGYVPSDSIASDPTRLGDAWTNGGASAEKAEDESEEGA